MSLRVSHSSGWWSRRHELSRARLGQSAPPYGPVDLNCPALIGCPPASVKPRLAIVVEGRIDGAMRHLDWPSPESLALCRRFA